MENIFDFIGGRDGTWEVIIIKAVTGDPIETVSHLKITRGSLTKSTEGTWSLKGIISNTRYADRREKEKLSAVQADLGRKEATCAALIPIRKSEAWWSLAQDERRKIFEEQSKHIQTGIKYLPPVARKLYHCRDIGEPFDFLTWFEYAPSYSPAFEELVDALRATEEWKYVDREIDIRLIKL